MGRRQRTGGLAALAAMLFFVGLAAVPWLYPTSTTPPWVTAAKNATPVVLPSTPTLPKAVTLSATAQPQSPADPPATQPIVDSSHSAALVAAEDARLRTVLQHSVRMTAPGIVVVPGSLATLVLPASPTPYTFADLVNDGAVQALDIGGWYLLVDSVFVAPGATLNISGNGLTRLLMAMSATGFTSLVTWEGTLSISGTAQTPIAVAGWDQVSNLPAEDQGYGRPYIRAVGGALNLDDVQVSSLGFWSGRTGGVAWTGISSQTSTGSATSSSFIGDTYGAFVSRSEKVAFTDDLFESNELDGLRLHRSASDSLVIGSAAVRNGGNGLVISRGANNDVLTGDAAIHNAGNGFLIDGQPLVSGASPSGGQAAPSTGSIVQSGMSENNGRAGILVEGGAGTVILNNTVCGTATGIAIRLGATATSVVGNGVGCGERIALSIGPSVVGTTVSGNTLMQSRIGILIRDSPGARIMNNRLALLSVFAISVRGASPGVVGNGNVISGKGFQPIDTQGGAAQPVLTGTDLRGWQRRVDATWISYLRYHPLLTIWLVFVVIVLVCWFAVRLRHWPALPYHHVTPWRPSETLAGLDDGSEGELLVSGSALI